MFLEVLDPIACDRVSRRMRGMRRRVSHPSAHATVSQKETNATTAKELLHLFKVFH